MVGIDWVGLGLVLGTGAEHKGGWVMGVQDAFYFVAVGFSWCCMGVTVTSVGRFVVGFICSVHGDTAWGCSANKWICTAGRWHSIYNRLINAGGRTSIR